MQIADFFITLTTILNGMSDAHVAQEIRIGALSDFEKIKSFGTTLAGRSQEQKEKWILRNTENLLANVSQAVEDHEGHVSSEVPPREPLSQPFHTLGCSQLSAVVRSQPTSTDLPVVGRNPKISEKRARSPLKPVEEHPPASAPETRTKKELALERRMERKADSEYRALRKSMAHLLPHDYGAFASSRLSHDSAGGG